MKELLFVSEVFYSCVLSLRQWELQRRRRETAHWDLGWCPQQLWPPFPTTAVHCCCSSILLPAQHFLLLTYTSQEGGALHRTQKCPQILLKQFSACKLGKKHQERKRAARVDFLVYRDLSWYIADWLNKMTVAIIIISQRGQASGICSSCF